MAIVVAVLSFGPGHLIPWAVLYIGPDSFLPFTSGLAAAAGVVLMFWNRLVGLGRKLWRTVAQKKD